MSFSQMVRTLGSNYFKRYNLSRNCPGSIGNMHMEKQISKQEDNLAFCTRALPPGKTFNRPLYGSFKIASKPHHFIRLTK